MAKPLTAIRLCDNAFRVLGLPANASQAEIVAAARRMRIWTDPGQIPPTLWDMPWLGGLFRSRNQVEQALARLTEPLSRIDERLFWFADERFTHSKPSRRAAIGAVSDSSDVAAIHDKALHGLAVVLVQDPEINDVNRWGAALTELNRAVTDSAYVDYFLAIEQAGDFEKIARPHEIRAILSRMAESITASIATRARDALEGGEFAMCMRLMRLLALATPDASARARWGTDILDKAEDLLIARCDRLTNGIATDLNWDRENMARNVVFNRKRCHEFASEMYATVEPLLEVIEAFGGPPSERWHRVSLKVAGMLRNLGLGWDWGRRYKDSHLVLNRALRLAHGTALAETIAADLQSLASRLKASRGLFNSKEWSPWQWACAALIFAVCVYVLILPAQLSSTPRPPTYTPPTIALPSYHPPVPVTLPGVDQRAYDDARRLGLGDTPPKAQPSPYAPPPVIDWGRFANPDGRPLPPKLWPPTSQPQ